MMAKIAPMTALMIRWMPKPIAGDELPAILAIMGSMPIIPIMTPKIRPPARPP